MTSAARSTTTTKTVGIGGHRIKFRVRHGKGVPLLVFNGIGTNLECLEELTTCLDGIETIVFDLPGVGGSSTPALPCGLRELAGLAGELLDALGYDTPVDVLGISWGGALAQQFAFSQPRRCRRLVLAATTPGALMVVSSPWRLAKMIAPGRHATSRCLRDIAPQLYGGEAASDPAVLKSYAQKLRPPHWRGYVYQQLAFACWTSLFWLPLLRQRTLVLAGRHDPLAPVVNSRILASLIPRAKLHIVNDGHLFLFTGPLKSARLIRTFLMAS